MKRILGLCTFALFGATTWAIPLQWTAASGGNDHWYEVVYAPRIDWQSARVAALGMWYNGLQAHLATTTSQAELDFVASVVQAQGYGEMYIGGYQNPLDETDPQAGWTWVNGEGTFPGYNSTSPFANWGDGEPNDYYDPGSEQYLGINLTGAMFNDEGNLDLIYGYVVEYDPNTRPDVPDAGATAPLMASALALLAMFGRRCR